MSPALQEKTSPQGHRDGLRIDHCVSRSPGENLTTEPQRRSEDRSPCLPLSRSRPYHKAIETVGGSITVPPALEIKTFPQSQRDGRGIDHRAFRSPGENLTTRPQRRSGDQSPCLPLSRSRPYHKTTETVWGPTTVPPALQGKASPQGHRDGLGIDHRVSRSPDQDLTTKPERRSGDPLPCLPLSGSRPHPKATETVGESITMSPALQGKTSPQGHRDGLGIDHRVFRSPGQDLTTRPQRRSGDRPPCLPLSRGRPHHKTTETVWGSITVSPTLQGKTSPQGHRDGLGIDHRVSRSPGQDLTTKPQRQSGDRPPCLPLSRGKPHHKATETVWGSITVSPALQGETSPQGHRDGLG